MTMLETKTQSHPLKICEYGITDYQKILQLQHQLREQRRNDEIPNTVLILEHNPVITLGARKSANKLLIDPDHIRTGNIDVVQIRRGGGITAHNPGQLVVYPILHLGQLKLGINDYTQFLQKTGIKLLQQLGIRSQMRKGCPGLWVDERKIASIGVRVSKLVTCHGMAINIQNDLSIFELFVPCGIEGVEITSVHIETGKEYDMKHVKSLLSELLTRHLSSKELTVHESCS
ncbi:MAG: lipoyl(octanoyl) transferase LipB [Planctomycetota bacterium]|jgi:lipoate-protein ligase B